MARKTDRPAPAERARAAFFELERRRRQGVAYRRFSYDTAIGNRVKPSGVPIGDLLLRLLYQEMGRSCDQCGAGDCTHGAAEAVLSIMSMEPFSYDSYIEQGTSFQGYPIDLLLRELLEREADVELDHGACGPAVTVLGIMRIVEH